MGNYTFSSQSNSTMLKKYIFFNSVLFPGGTAKLDPTLGHTAAAIQIYQIAQKMNNDNKFMPLFGIARGFELLLYLSTSKLEFREKCSSDQRSLALNFESGKTDITHNMNIHLIFSIILGFKGSRMFGSAPDQIMKILKNENVTPNSHTYCVTIRASRHGLWKICAPTNLCLICIFNSQ